MREPKHTVEEILEAAIAMPDPAARKAYLDEVCSGDCHRHQEVASLLEAHGEATDFLDSPLAAIAEVAAENGFSCVSEMAGDRIGRYKLIEQIGAGGFGTVWMAQQEQPVRRRVALKILRLGMDTQQVVARFEAERQALALMDHPSIAKVFDGGTTGTGRPYFVMELVRGIPITHYCDRHNLSTIERLKVFMRVCHAVEHAHQKGLIHRDLKPSNVLIATHDGPAAAGCPKIIDFGIAKATEHPLVDRTLFTRFAQFLGTPAYMSPEQTEMTSLDIDTRSDIYSLGVLLYELLTGRTPFDTKELAESGFDEMRRIIREREPERPSARLRKLDLADSSMASRLVPRSSSLAADLDWVVMKCLEKDRARRYETVTGLIRDLERHLHHEPVLARPPSRLYRLRKMVRRNRLAFMAAAVTTVALVTGLGVAKWRMVEERAARRRAEAAELRAQKSLWNAYLAQARATRMSGQAGRRFDSLETLAKAATIRPSPDLRNEAIASLALYDLRVVRRLPGGSDTTPVAALDRRNDRYARVDRAGNISVRGLHDDAEVAALPGFGNHGVMLSFGAGGRYLAAKYDPREKSPVQKSVLLVWDIERRQAVMGLTNVLIEKAVGLHPFEPRLAVGRGSRLLDVYDLAAGRLERSIALEARPYAVEFSRQGDLVAVASQAQSVALVVDWAKGEVLRKLPHNGGVHSVDWHPQGSLLASGCADRRVYLWDARQGQLLGVLDGHTAPVVNLAFHPGGEVLASTGWDSTLWLWDAPRQEPLLRMPGRAPSLEFDFSASLLGFTAEGSTLNLLELAPTPVCRALVAGSEIQAQDAAFSHDGRVLAVSVGDGVLLWDVTRRGAAARIPLKWGRSVLFPGGDRDLIVSAKGALERWPMATGQGDATVVRFGPPERFSVPKRVENACLIPGTRRVAMAGVGTAMILDLDQPAHRTALSGHANATFICASPDGRWIATGSWPSSEHVVIWDARNGEPAFHLPVAGPAYVRFSPNGQWLVVATQGEYILHSACTWEVIRRFAADPTINHGSIVFSPDARVLAFRNSACTVSLLRPGDGRELALLPGDKPFPLCFSPDGTLLVVADATTTVRVWDLRRAREGLAELNLDWDLPPYPPAQETSQAPLRIELVTD